MSQKDASIEKNRLSSISSTCLLMNKYNIDFDLKYLRYLIITHFSSIT